MNNNNNINSANNNQQIPFNGNAIPTNGNNGNNVNTGFEYVNNNVNTNLNPQFNGNSQTINNGIFDNGSQVTNNMMPSNNGNINNQGISSNNVNNISQVNANYDLMNIIDSVNYQNNTDNDDNQTNNIKMQPNNNFDKSFEIDDKELLSTFVGNNYDKISTNSINVSALLFGVFYLLYRKMFWYGILLFILEIIIYNIFNIPYLILVVNIILCFTFNKFYLSISKKRINTLKKKNPTAGQAGLVLLCSKYGGTSVGNIILGFLVEIIIVVLCLIILSFFGVGNVIFNSFLKPMLNLPSEINDIIETNDATYNGTLLFDTSVNLKNNVSINIPSDFEDESTDYSYSYVFASNNGVFDDCRVNLHIPTGYSDANNLINQLHDYNVNYSPSDVSKKVVNSNDWYWFSYNNAFGNSYYYATTIGNKVYLLEYEIQTDAPDNCNNYREGIVNSIVIK